MYENYYGLKEKPFSLTPDPRFLYLSKQHQGALDHMLYGIRQREGFMTIVGDVGTGKTTLCRCLLDRLDKNIQVALILNPMLSDIDLLRTCLHDLGVRPQRRKLENLIAAAAVAASPEYQTTAEPDDFDSSWFDALSKKELIDHLNTFLLKQHREGKSTVLIIDEAQNLSWEVMEQLRILSNLETEREKLIQIIFVGQLELKARLNEPKLKQLNQRISIRYEIAPLTMDEALNYIRHRLMVAGASSRISFSKSSLSEVYNYSKGYPRLINLVCDRALLAGFNAQADTIESKHVKDGIKSLLGQDDKNYFLTRFLQNRLPLIVSILFFIAGLASFWMARSRPVSDIRETTAAAQSAPAAQVKPSQQTSSVNSQAAENPVIKEQAISASTTAATPTEPNAPVEEGDFRIQVYALDKKIFAQEHTAKLEQEGFKAYWKQVESAGTTWFVVYVGPFKKIDSARTQLQSLKESGRNPILLSVSKAL